MPAVGLRELSRQTGDVLDRVEREGQPLVVTRQGRPVAALIPIDDARLEDLALSAAVAETVTASQNAVHEGATRSLADVMADIEPPESPSVPISAIASAGEPVPSAEVEGARYAQLVTELSRRVAAMPEFSPALHESGISPEEAGRLQEINTRILATSLARPLAEAAVRIKACRRLVLREMSAAEPDEGWSLVAELLRVGPVVNAYVAEREGVSISSIDEIGIELADDEVVADLRPRRGRRPSRN